MNYTSGMYLPLFCFLDFSLNNVVFQNIRRFYLSNQS